MAYRAIPPVFNGFIDDAAVFPPGNAAVGTALENHRRYRRAWYRDLVGPLLLPVSKLSQVPDQDEPLPIGLIADTGVAALVPAVEKLPGNCVPAQIEARPTADDDLATLAGLADRFGIPVFAEIPVASDFDVELPLLRHAGATPKFRTGGLRAELFPSPAELATAIIACARQDMSFKLTAGLHQFTRHTDPATGFTHHGFGNVLAAAELAHRSESVETVTECLEIRDSTVLAERVRHMLGYQRPLWVGFGSCSIDEPLDDLSGLSLVNKEN
ncbi:hypothetical protein FB566_2896 [Stackebrandtia endophytica]|uniref:HpcH/HpaI aldolase/citrate lyase family protein n=1 Tax=Stackebrandtia endophytica TaxID=1496996 RepID=A0A543AXN9_9ACTN|nr:hypothetical protein [Stackebrandtia endophytica]TQL77337.1 hypothetical protein FB566_2896 [Stackebrandtia endophytica]